MKTLFIIFFFIFGLVFGSFLNVIGLRTPKKETFVKGRSHCPNCGHDMVYRTNRYGTFEACSNYPACKYIKKKDEPEPMVDLIPCPECSTGHLVSKVAKTGRYAGRKFYGCSNFPECKFTISYINQKKQK